MTTRPFTRTRPVTCSHFPVSRFRPASRFHPGPFAFFPVTHTEKTSSFRTQSAERSRLAEGRSPKRFCPRNWPRTVTVFDSYRCGFVTRSSRVTGVEALFAAFSSGGPR